MSHQPPGQEPEKVITTMILTIRLALLTIVFATAWAMLYLLRTDGH